jgi:hypothetical protein
MKKLLIIFSVFALVSSCNKKLDSLVQSPNGPDVTTANVDLLLNTVQLQFADFYNNIGDFGGALTRQYQWYGPLYNNGYTANSFDGVWSTAYTGVIVNADKTIDLATKEKKFVQAGIAKVLKAFTYGTLVDYFGDIPFDKAAKGELDLNPSITKGDKVYAGVFTLLDSAIADFGKSGAATGPANDLFYKGSTTEWIKIANTLKLKFYTQIRLVDTSASSKIKNLLTENNLILDQASDFEFKYSTNINSPDSRHPHYTSNYTATGNAGDFIGNYFLWTVAAKKTNGVVTNTDPRRRFYFYRQRTNYADVNQQSCTCAFENVPGHYPSVPDKTPFCLVGSGYWGRDHGDNSGIPPDANLRTTWGVYPAGGEFDANQGKSVKLEMGGKGAGIAPIWLASFTNFIKAEIALKMGITEAGSAKVLLENGIRASINKVLGFPATINVSVSSSLMPSSTAINSYVNLVLTEFDAATSVDQQLEIVMREYYIALWGNGTESYNNYRRTGYPSDMQPVKSTSTPGFFPRSNFYPSVYVNRNQNAPTQKNIGIAPNKVFWDNNADNFVK